MSLDQRDLRFVRLAASNYLDSYETDVLLERMRLVFDGAKLTVLYEPRFSALLKENEPLIMGAISLVVAKLAGIFPTEWHWVECEERHDGVIWNGQLMKYQSSVQLPPAQQVWQEVVQLFSHRNTSMDLLRMMSSADVWLQDGELHVHANWRLASWLDDWHFLWLPIVRDAMGFHGADVIFRFADPIACSPWEPFPTYPSPAEWNALPAGHLPYPTLEDWRSLQICGWGQHHYGLVCYYPREAEESISRNKDLVCEAMRAGAGPWPVKFVPTWIPHVQPFYRPAIDPIGL
ncbi:MAG: hypothetical protein ACOX9R_08535 [Armatimonadota bacterium]|jgi:hypothetical protein